MTTVNRLLPEGYDPLKKHSATANMIMPEDDEAEKWDEIFATIMNDNDVEFKKLTESVSDFNIEIVGQHSLLGCAAANSPAILDYLLDDKKCDVNIRASGADYETALFAAKGENIYTLLEHGADEYVQDINGDTPLTKVIRAGDYKFAAQFYKQGMHMDATDAYNNTALFLAAATPAAPVDTDAEERFWNNFFDACDVETNLRSLLNRKCSKGRTPLHLAVALNREDLAKRMISYGANMTIINDDGERPKVPDEWLEDLVIKGTFEEEQEAAAANEAAAADSAPALASTGKNHLSEAEAALYEDLDEANAAVEAELNHEENLVASHHDELTTPNLVEGYPSEGFNDNLGVEMGFADDLQSPNIATDETKEDEIKNDDNVQEPYDNADHAGLAVGNEDVDTGLELNDEYAKVIEDIEDPLVIPFADDENGDFTGGQRETETTLALQSSGRLQHLDEMDELNDDDVDEEEAEEENEQVKLEKQNLALMRARIAQLAADNSALLDALTAIKRQQDVLQRDNGELQKRVAAAMWIKNVNNIQTTDGLLHQNHKTSGIDNQDGQGAAIGIETRISAPKYHSVLRHVHEVRAKLREGQARAARVTAELRAELEEKSLRAAEAQEALREFQRALARNAEYARTGRRIPVEVLQAIEDFEADKERQVAEVRGSNISLKNKLARLQMELRKRDELAENLHVIDFEQLKVENQTLNEKIEERQEELRRLERKAVAAIELATHVKEKLAFVKRKNSQIAELVRQSDENLATIRTQLNRAKKMRDEYRDATARNRTAKGLINSTVIVQDHRKREQKVVDLEQEVQQLAAHHKALEQFARKAKAELHAHEIRQNQVDASRSRLGGFR